MIGRSHLVLAARVRYGEPPEDPVEVVRVRRAWVRIRRAAQRVVPRRER